METYKVFDGTGDDGTQVVDVSEYYIAAVTIAANTGSPDGTVVVYDQSPGGDLVAVATYATPSLPRKWTGSAWSKLLFVLSGNTTGTIDVWLELKK